MTQFEISPVVAEYVATLRREVDDALDVAMHLNSECPKRLSEAIRYSLLAPGKRLRPILVMTSCELCGGERILATPAACAVEMVHAYSLIHDDLPAMDDDDLRRGMPTCHKKFDEATAILAGDAVLALAFEMIGNLTPPELAGRCCKELAVASGPCQLVGGQMDDVSRDLAETIGTLAHWREAPEISRELMERIHIRKTGALMRVSLKLGGMVAGATDEQLEALDQYGINFGLAFQITDDLLDVLGDEQTAGKRVGKDAGMDKLSYTNLLGVDEARQEAEKAVRRAEDALKNVVLNTGLSEDSPPFETLLCTVRSLLDRKK